MARGAVLARQEAKKVARRAERIAAEDVLVRAMLERPFEFTLQDWSLVRCEACGLEQGSGRPPCAGCGNETATYAEEASQ